MELEDLAAATGPSESVEDLVARRELSGVVEAAMARLPEEQRTAIILKEYHGMTFQEIADLQGCPLSTVKTRLYQGLSVLRRDLGATARCREARCGRRSRMTMKNDTDDALLPREAGRRHCAATPRR